MNRLPAVQILSPQKVCPGGLLDPSGPCQLPSLFQVPHGDWVRPYNEKGNFERKFVTKVCAEVHGVIKYLGIERDSGNKAVLNN